MQKQFPLSVLVFIDSLVVSASQDAGGYAISRQNNLVSNCIWVAIPVDWVISHWYACGANGRMLGRSVYGHVITKFSRMGRLLYFLTMVLRWRATRARAPL